MPCGGALSRLQSDFWHAPPSQALGPPTPALASELATNGSSIRPCSPEGQGLLLCSGSLPCLSESMAYVTHTAKWDFAKLQFEHHHLHLAFHQACAGVELAVLPRSSLHADRAAGREVTGASGLGPRNRLCQRIHHRSHQDFENVALCAKPLPRLARSAKQLSIEPDNPSMMVLVSLDQVQRPYLAAGTEAMEPATSATQKRCRSHRSGCHGSASWRHRAARVYAAILPNPKRDRDCPLAVPLAISATGSASQPHRDEVHCSVSWRRVVRDCHGSANWQRAVRLRGSIPPNPRPDRNRPLVPPLTSSTRENGCQSRRGDCCGSANFHRALPVFGATPSNPTRDQGRFLVVKHPRPAATGPLVRQQDVEGSSDPAAARPSSPKTQRRS
mmetsp:Transcript_54740/g.177863  ORF Transcript_54740/g.177863 Transcript_54740/m.177863 type:complete len:387 (-) Transcript_54740:2111-3271(-)